MKVEITFHAKTKRKAELPFLMTSLQWILIRNSQYVFHFGYSHNYVKEKLYLVVFPVLFRCNFVSLAERVKQAWPWWSSWYWTARSPNILDLYIYPSLKDDFKQASCNLIGLRLQPKPHRENRFANNKYTKSLKNTYCLKNVVLYPNWYFCYFGRY